jgi:predicted membrane metal-binding protein
MLHLSDLTDYELCEIKEISPLYRLFNEYKNQELMYTVVFFILLMYMEEFLFAFRKRKRKKSKENFDIFHFVEYLLVRLGYARPFIIQTMIFERHDQISID